MLTRNFPNLRIDSAGVSWAFREVVQRRPEWLFEMRAAARRAEESGRRDPVANAVIRLLMVLFFRRELVVRGLGWSGVGERGESRNTVRVLRRIIREGVLGMEEGSLRGGSGARSLWGLIR